MHDACRVWRLEGGTAAQRRIVRLALRDITRTLGRQHIARAHGPHCRQILIDDTLFGPADTNHRAYHLAAPPNPRSHLIALRTTLHGARLYETFVHEFGHYLGLPHASSGVMAATGGTRRSLPPTSRQRIRIMRQLSICVALRISHILLDAST